MHITDQQINFKLQIKHNNKKNNNNKYTKMLNSFNSFHFGPK